MRQLNECVHLQVYVYVVTLTLVRGGNLFILLLWFSSSSKHIFVPNFVDMECGYMPLDGPGGLGAEQLHLVESHYEARTEKELPVLVQYVRRERVQAPKATHLDIILYSREQITKENLAMGTEVSSIAWYSRA